MRKFVLAVNSPLLRWMLLAFLVLLVSGTWVYSAEEIPDALRKRIHAYHEARLNGDWTEVYGFFYSGFRESFEKKRFLNIPKTVQITDFEIGEIEMGADGQRAIAKVREGIVFQAFELEGSFRPETWVLEDGDWFLEFEPKMQLP